MDTVTAKPAQLRKITLFICEEERSCDLQWLRVATKKLLILERRVTNIDQDFDQDGRSDYGPYDFTRGSASIGKIFAGSGGRLSLIGL